MLLGNKYELGRTLGEGNFGKVRLATDTATGKAYAVKILDKRRVLDLRVHEQIKREIGTLKLLRHPNVVRLHEVLASKTKIYMVLELVTGGELFDKIASKGRLPEHEGRKLFQQLIDAVGYCHERGVYHRDLKPENVLVDSEGNIKISDFGLSALPQHLGRDGLLHTTCGSPNYVAPEVLSNRGYDGAKSDLWSSGVILYVVLTGSLPFDDRNLAVLYQKIFKGDVHIPKWLSPGAKNMIRRILDPNPRTRITVEGIKSDPWFKLGYVPAVPDENDEDVDAFSITEIADTDSCGKLPSPINAFELIGMSSSLDLSGLFENEDVAQRKIRFTSKHSNKYLFERIEAIACDMGFQVHKKPKKHNVMHLHENKRNHASLSVAIEVFELGDSLSVVETRKLQGDSLLYKELYTTLCDELSIRRGQQLLTGPPAPQLLTGPPAPPKAELTAINGEMPITAL